MNPENQETEDTIHITNPGSAATWDYQPDPDVVEILLETETVDTAGSALGEALELHTAESPELAGGDVDADWQRAADVGEEMVGGSVPTPDQDRVDELGAAWGVTYNDDETIHTIDKLAKRDRDRWELNPASEDRPGDEPGAGAEGV
jgi:hypothetical protein